MSLRIHAICLALNEEPFIEELLKPLYPFCSGMSVITQYDRDWYWKPIQPDKTAQLVLNFPDPEGKIHFVVRRHRDEAVARNQEMLAVRNSSTKRIVPFSDSKEKIKEFYSAPDYFLIVDADEIYDVDTLGNIIDYLKSKKPRGMRVRGYNYVRTWNRRVPSEIVDFNHFGFIKPSVLFQVRRIVSLKEMSLARLFSRLKLPNFAPGLYGFIDCPPEVGFFHHGCWLGDTERLKKKVAISSHPQTWDLGFADWVDSMKTVFIPTSDLPSNIREGNWPSHFFEPSTEAQVSEISHRSKD
jgi:hypothetical protein